jgi:trk system potassium uptake protein TrkA
MKVLIAGAGKLGRQAAHLLSSTGHQVTVIDQDAAALTKLDGERLHRTVRGDACEPSVLEEAGAFTVDMLLAATGEDEDNLAISLLAMRQFAVPRVLSRVNDPDNAWLFDQRWGVDVVLPAASPLVALIEEAAGAADTIGLLRLAAAGVSLIETRIGPESAAAGRALDDVVLPAGTVVAAVVRDGQPTVPGRGHRLLPGDVLLVVTHTATDADIHAAFQ